MHPPSPANTDIQHSNDSGAKSGGLTGTKILELFGPSGDTEFSGCKANLQLKDVGKCSSCCWTDEEQEEIADAGGFSAGEYDANDSGKESKSTSQF